MEGILEVLHGENRSHEGAIVAVGAGAEESDEDAEVELKRLLAAGVDVGLLDGGVQFGLETLAVSAVSNI